MPKTKFKSRHDMLVNGKVLKRGDTIELDLEDPKDAKLFGDLAGSNRLEEVASATPEGPAPASKPATPSK